MFTVLEYLKSVTAVGLLPVPHQILIRRMNYGPGIQSWFTSYMWGVIYLRNLTPSTPVWQDTKIKLFTVKSVPSS